LCSFFVEPVYQSKVFDGSAGSSSTCSEVDSPERSSFPLGVPDQMSKLADQAGSGAAIVVE